MSIKILLAEDDEYICQTAKAFLERSGFAVDASFDGDTAVKMFYDNSYQLVILDIMLPSLDGYEVLREIRKISDVSALFITALDDDAHQIKAFSYKADDYITKPFSMQVLIKRVEAILRRSGFLKKEICLGDLTLFPMSYTAFYGKIDMRLTPKEFEILFLMVQNKGNIVSREKILINIWGYDFDGNERITDTHIKNLRAKLPVDIIKTVKGVGYRLEESE